MKDTNKKIEKAFSVEKLSSLYCEEISKRKAKKLTLTDEMKEIFGDNDKIYNALENGGRAFMYKHKGEIEAMCVFELLERNIPVSLSEITFNDKIDLNENTEANEKKIKKLANATEEFFKQTDSDNNRNVTTDENTVYEMKKCYVLTGFYVNKSNEENRSEYEKKFKNMIRDFLMGEDKIYGYIWGDDVVLSNRLKIGGKSYDMYAVGMIIGILCGVIFGLTGVWDMVTSICIGMLLGGAMAFGTSTLANKSRDGKSEEK